MIRYWRCVLAQGFLKGLIWVALITGAGYAAFKDADRCNEVCVKARALK